MKRFLWCLLAASLIFLSGCAYLFGKPVPILDENGKQTYDENGNQMMRYEDGVVQKGVRILAPVAGAVPYGQAGLGVLAILGVLGTAVQTIRSKGKIEKDDVRQMIDELGPKVKEVMGDKDLGDLVAAWSTDTYTARMRTLADKLKAAFEKNRAKAGKLLVAPAA